MKRFYFSIACLITCLCAFSQQIVEDFEANSFGWTEYNYSSSYFASIAKGKLSITSDVVRYSSSTETGTMALIMDLLDPDPVPTHWNRMAASHCIAPIDVQKPFTIRANITKSSFESSSCVGILFNYRDEMNYYCILIPIF